MERRRASQARTGGLSDLETFVSDTTRSVLCDLLHNMLRIFPQLVGEKLDLKLPGGGGMLGGPPGIGCVCSGGGIGFPKAGASPGCCCCSRSSHSVLKSPELNLSTEKQHSNDSRLPA